VALRWKLLIVIGLLVALIDQGTKFLAVRNLTPGIARAYLASQQSPVVPESDEHKVIEGLSLTDQLGLFYGAVREPCASSLSRCPSVAMVSGFWNWRYVENKGAAWGLLAGVSEAVRIPFFILVSVVAIAFIIVFFRKLPDTQLLMIISLSLVMGGAIGNFVDRLHLNYVIDFIDWYLGTNHWPTFNFADAAITTGVVLLVIQWTRDWAAGKSEQGDRSQRESVRESSPGGSS
jgi:signal peptidase II